MRHIPALVLERTPEVEFCCGTLCDRSKLYTEITGQIERVLLLETALREINPQHPLLRDENGTSNRK